MAILVGLTGRSDPDLKLNGIWGLMVSQTKDLKSSTP